MRRSESTLLCTGDLHLGRHPTRIPADRDSTVFSPGSVWRATVDRAVRANVDVVVVTGDVVDLENRYYEAYGAFEAGVRCLADEGIPLIVVGGNHDAEVLPRLIDDTDAENVRFLGRNGTWERHVVRNDGKPVLNLDGWSFPGKHVRESPLPSYRIPDDNNCPIMGLLHADLDVTDSDYGPVRSAELANTGVDGWLLGHIHKPEVCRSQSPFILYPGTPQPLDPGETGVHGPWLVRVGNQGSCEAEQLPLGSVRYESFEIDASSATDSKDIPRLVSNVLSEWAETEPEQPCTELLLTRIVLTGRCQAHAELRATREALLDQMQFRVGGTPVLVESLEIETRPSADVEELARGNSPVASIANLLLQLENEDFQDTPGALIEECMDVMRTALDASAYRPLHRMRAVSSPTREKACDKLIRQGRFLLDMLLRQKEDRK